MPFVRLNYLNIVILPQVAGFYYHSMLKVIVVGIHHHLIFTVETNKLIDKFIFNGCLCDEVKSGQN